MPNILIVEDDLTFLKILKNFLEKNGFRTQAVKTVASAFESFSKEKFDLILTDYRLPDGDGLNILKSVKEKYPGQKVMVMTRYSDLNTGISSMKLGALDFIVKPINPDELLITLKEALKENTTKVIDNLEVTGKQKVTLPGYVKGKSKVAAKLHDQINLVAPTDMSVIIQGESGTGKEIVARLIHEMSSRKNGPFIAVDCGAISNEIASSELFGHLKGSFTGAVMNKTGQMEAANKGTLFLDEIGNLSYDVQVKLLRAIQERRIKKVGDVKDVKIDVRIIVASNEDLRNSIAKGKFREDLFHRLNEFGISVPSLRERKADLEDFTWHFVELSNQELNKNVRLIEDDVWEMIRNYNWPGNIREFKNIMKRAVLMSKAETLYLQSFPEDIVLESETPRIHEINDHNTSGPDSPDLKELISLNEREMIIRTLKANKYNKSKTARILKIDRKTLYAKIEKYNIDA